MWAFCDTILPTSFACAACVPPAPFDLAIAVSISGILFTTSSGSKSTSTLKNPKLPPNLPPPSPAFIQFFKKFVSNLKLLIVSTSPPKLPIPIPTTLTQAFLICDDWLSGILILKSSWTETPSL